MTDGQWWMFVFLPSLIPPAAVFAFFAYVLIVEPIVLRIEHAKKLHEQERSEDLAYQRSLRRCGHYQKVLATERHNEIVRARKWYRFLVLPKS